SAVCESLAAGLIHGIYNAAGDAEPQRAETEAELDNRARSRCRSRGRDGQSRSELYLPGSNIGRGRSEYLLSPAQHPTPLNVVIARGQLLGSCAALAVGELGVSQPVTCLGGKGRQSHGLIMPNVPQVVPPRLGADEAVGSCSLTAGIAARRLRGTP